MIKLGTFPCRGPSFLLLHEHLSRLLCQAGSTHLKCQKIRELLKLKYPSSIQSWGGLVAHRRSKTEITRNYIVIS